ncbi:hypothetical protein [Pseudonocardia sp. KRD291]|uniref:hypothetical protein n=1 Tax=Pseudonocardia sp. KRD291 TaxID=2792007 RepID=UPI001C4A0E6B|nr:hypothetical protein [Pseudonocardia sp. KRD291]MBW0103615.1 hypothetical protein [Pseudonocardia sp. KRD291]
MSEADTLTDLHVVTAIDDPAALEEAVCTARLGRTEPGETGHVFVDIERLRSLARTGAVRDDWDDRFDAMIAYAERKGWLDDTGNAARAHVDRSG